MKAEGFLKLLPISQRHACIKSLSSGTPEGLLQVWMDDNLKYFSKPVLIKTLAGLSAYHHNHATTYLKHCWKYSNSWDSLSWSWNLHPDSRFQALQYSPQICTSFRGATQINSVMNDSANIPFLWKNPVNVSCKWADKLNRKKKKGNVRTTKYFLRTAALYPQMLRTALWKTPNWDERVHPANLETAGYSSCNWCKVVDQFSLYRLILCLSMTWHITKKNVEV